MKGSQIERQILKFLQNMSSRSTHDQTIFSANTGPNLPKGRYNNGRFAQHISCLTELEERERQTCRGFRRQALPLFIALFRQLATAPPLEFFHVAARAPSALKSPPPVRSSGDMEFLEPSRLSLLLAMLLGCGFEWQVVLVGLTVRDVRVN